MVYIQLLSQNENVSGITKEYALTIKEKAINAIGNVIFTKWLQGKWTDSLVKEYKKIVNVLADKNKTYGASISAGEVCKNIEEELFYNFDTSGINRFYLYFMNPDWNIEEQIVDDNEVEIDNKKVEKDAKVKETSLANCEDEFEKLIEKIINDEETSENKIAEYFENYKDFKKYMSEKYSIENNQFEYEVFCNENYREAWVSYYKYYSKLKNRLDMTYYPSFALEMAKKKYKGKKTYFRILWELNASTALEQTLLDNEKYAMVYDKIKGEVSLELFLVIVGAIDLVEYWMSVGAISKKKYSDLMRKGSFEDYLDGFLINMIAQFYKPESAYIWGMDNWFGEKLIKINDIKDTEKCFKKMRIIIRNIVFRSDVMKHWLLVPTLDKLVADDLTFHELYDANTRKESKYCLNGGMLTTRDAEDILIDSQIVHWVKNKQNRSEKDPSQAEESERHKVETQNDINSAKRDYWTIYSYEKKCVEYLLDELKDKEGKRIQLLKYTEQLSNRQSFQNIKMHFDEIMQVDEKEDYMSVYYLNQFIHFDIAIELMYGLSQIMNVKPETYKKLSTEINLLSNVLVQLHTVIKSGVGEIVHECFKMKKKQIGENQYAEEECGVFLQELGNLIKEFLKENDIKEIQNFFYQGLIQTHWEMVEDVANLTIDNMNPIQDFYIVLENFMNKYDIKNKENHRKQIKDDVYNKSICLMLQEIQDRDTKSMYGLKISEEAWESVMKNCSDTRKGENRGQYAMLYRRIQNACINANFTKNETEHNIDE